MRFPFKNPFYHKDKGVPDSPHHGGIPQLSNCNQQNDASVVVPISAHHSVSHTSLPPTGYPINNYSNSINHPNIVAPPFAYPYTVQQDDHELKKGPEWEINAGNNMNMKGHQRAGNIKVANGANHCASAITIPQNGRFVLNAGGNYNAGDLQESGTIEFGNVR